MVSPNGPVAMGITAPAAARRAGRSRQAPWVVTGFLLLTLVAAVASQGGVALLLAPVLFAAVVYAIWRAPLRHTVFALMALAVTLENPSDVPACGMWRSPLYDLGAMTLAHLNLTLPYKWLIFSGMDLLLAAVGVVAWVRGPRSKVDGYGVSPARPMGQFAWICIGGAAGMWTYGLLCTDFDFASSLWQVQRVIYLPVMYLLFRRVFRGVQDARAFATVIVAAAILKTAVALYVRHTVLPPAGETTLQYATTHADSMLFSVAICLTLAPLFEHYDRKRLLTALAIVPLLVCGIVANTRRLAWVEVGVGVLTLFFASHPTRWKRRVSRTVLLLSPVIALYVAVGWNSEAGFFKPAHVFHSVVDSKADASTEWRDWENYNLFYTIRHAPIFGIGYGHGYTERVKLPDISKEYSLYRFIPHNSILGLWAYGGLIGFSALWAMLVAAGYFGARAQRFAQTSEERTVALSVPVILGIYLAHCYGDMGLGTWTANFIVAPTLAIAANLAVCTGGWPGGPRRDAGPTVVLAGSRPSTRHLTALATRRPG